MPLDYVVCRESVCSWLRLTYYYSSSGVNLFLSLLCLSTEQDGWPVQTQMQRSSSGWWEKCLFSGPNPTWVTCPPHLCAALWFFLDIFFCFFVFLFFYFYFVMQSCFSVIFGRILNERSRTLWWWMKSTTCPSSLLTVRARWARWERKSRQVALKKQNITCHLLRCQITYFIFWAVTYQRN